MSSLIEHSYAVILAGGGGTRLWPKSRKRTPKQLLHIVGKETLLKNTFDRIFPLIPKKRIYVITHKDHAAEVKKQLPNLLSENLIIEPESKNTALAMGVAAAFIKAKDPQALIVNLAADHVIEDQIKFRECVLAALDSAGQNEYIVAIGIRGNFPHIGLGYIRIGEQLGKIRVGKRDIFVFKSKGFKEKPDLATAQSFIASGQYLWNANLYCWSVESIFNAMEEYSPEIFKGVERIFKDIGTKYEKKTLEKVYKKSENVSIDYAISEKAKNIVLIPGDFGWSDIGDWQVVYDIQAKDSSGNVIVNSKNSDLLVLDSKNCLIEANGRLIVTVGVEDLVVIDSEDAILIASKVKAQDVKKAVEKLKELKKDKYL